jgi:G3E family GTPase
MSHIRAQKKNQNARQAMVISGLSTIYRNTSASHAIKSHQQTAPRIYFLNISLDDINKAYPKIRQIIEKGTARYTVKTQTEHLLLTETDIYEIRLSKPAAGNSRDRDHDLHLRVPVDGNVTIKEIHLKVSGGDGHGHGSDDGKHASRDYNIPVLIDESYYELNHTRDAAAPTAAIGRHIPPNHKHVVRVKKTIKFHTGSPNAFVFETDTDIEAGSEAGSEADTADVTDFYMTTDDGIIPQSDKLNNTFREDMISFLLQFKLCS